MAKIRLDIDALRVESFDTIVGEAAARGTVHGRAGVRDLGEAGFIDTAIYLCTPRTICHNSCADTCVDGCPASVPC